MSVFPFEHGRPVGYNAQMGLIVLQSDETLEYELRRIFPEDGVAPVSYTHLTLPTIYSV